MITLSDVTMLFGSTTAVNKISIPDFEFRALGDASSPTGFVGTYSFSD